MGLFVLPKKEKYERDGIQAQVAARPGEATARPGEATVFALNGAKRVAVFRAFLGEWRFLKRPLMRNRLDNARISATRFKMSDLPPLVACIQTDARPR